jgi:hypothetical protein
MCRFQRLQLSVAKKVCKIQPDVILWKNLCMYIYNWTTRGLCYNHDFYLFSAKNGVLLVNQCYDRQFEKKSTTLSKKRQTFRRKYFFLITTSVPDLQPSILNIVPLAKLSTPMAFHVVVKVGSSLFSSDFLQKKQSSLAARKPPLVARYASAEAGS